MKKGGGKLGGCLGTPMRALSRACDSACDLYVRGMSGVARRVPSGAVPVGRSFGRSVTTMHFPRASSDRADDLVRAAAASKQLRVAAVKKGQAPAGPGPRKKDAAMGTVAEDAPCEFVDADGACAVFYAMKPAAEPMRCGAPVGGLAARAGGFGAIKVGSEGFAR